MMQSINMNFLIHSGSKFIISQAFKYLNAAWQIYTVERYSFIYLLLDSRIRLFLQILVNLLFKYNENKSKLGKTEFTVLTF